MVIVFGFRVQRALIGFDGKAKTHVVAFNEETDEVFFVFRRHDVERVAAVL